MRFGSNVVGFRGIDVPAYLIHRVQRDDLEFFADGVYKRGVYLQALVVPKILRHHLQIAGLTTLAYQHKLVGAIDRQPVKEVAEALKIYAAIVTKIVMLAAAVDEQVAVIAKELAAARVKGANVFDIGCATVSHDW